MKAYDVVIIGGGVIGCATAFHLALSGQRNIILIEKDSLASGSTGRCAGGIRAQWSTEGNIILAKNSIKEFKSFKKLTGQNIQFRQGGYLLPAYSEQTAQQLKKNVALQKKFNLPVEIISPKEATKITPALNPHNLKLAAFSPNDGVANPFLVVKGYSEAAKKMGVHFLLKKEVVALQSNGNKITAVILHDSSKIPCSFVINTAGPWAHIIAKKANTSLPIKTFRHQILVTEPLELFHKPMIIDLDHNLYFCQQQDGGILAGQTDYHEQPSFNIKNSHLFIVNISRKLCFHFQSFKNLNVIRQWAGLYSMTPDAQPILGQTGPFPNFLSACGFSGHGFMLAPASAKIISQILLNKKTDIPIHLFSIDRFKKGISSYEKSIV